MPGIGGFASNIVFYAAQTILSLIKLKPTVIRGNASEIMAVAGATGAVTRGVDSTAKAEEALDAGAQLAKEVGCVVAITGAVDLVGGLGVWPLSSKAGHFLSSPLLSDNLPDPPSYCAGDGWRSGVTGSKRHPYAEAHHSNWVFCNGDGGCIRELCAQGTRPPGHGFCARNVWVRYLHWSVVASPTIVDRSLIVFPGW